MTYEMGTWTETPERYHERMERLQSHFLRMCRIADKNIMLNDEEKSCSAKTFDYVNPVVFKDTDDLIASGGSISAMLDFPNGNIVMDGDIPVWEGDVFDKALGTNVHERFHKYAHPYKFKELHDGIPKHSDVRHITEIINSMEGCEVDEYHYHRESIHVHFVCYASEDRLDQMTSQFKGLIEAVNISVMPDL